MHPQFAPTALHVARNFAISAIRRFSVAHTVFTACSQQLAALCLCQKRVVYSNRISICIQFHLLLQPLVQLRANSATAFGCMRTVTSFSHGPIDCAAAASAKCVYYPMPANLGTARHGLSSATLVAFPAATTVEMVSAQFCCGVSLSGNCPASFYSWLRIPSCSPVLPQRWRHCNSCSLMQKCRFRWFMSCSSSSHAIRLA